MANPIENAVDRKVRLALTKDIEKQLLDTQRAIHNVLLASKQHPVDRNAVLISGRESLTQAELSMATTLATVTTRLTTVLDRLPFRDRISRDAVGDCLILANALQMALWSALKYIGGPIG